jgi:hypothetical protein
MDGWIGIELLCFCFYSPSSQRLKAAGKRETGAIMIDGLYKRASKKEVHRTHKNVENKEQDEISQKERLT